MKFLFFLGLVAFAHAQSGEEPEIEEPEILSSSGHKISGPWCKNAYKKPIEIDGGCYTTQLYESKGKFYGLLVDAEDKNKNIEWTFETAPSGDGYIIYQCVKEKCRYLREQKRDDWVLVDNDKNKASVWNLHEIDRKEVGDTWQGGYEITSKKTGDHLAYDNPFLGSYWLTTRKEHQWWLVQPAISIVKKEE